MSNKPIHEFQFGDVRASIWANDPSHGTKYHVTFQRLYRDGEDWKPATGLRMLDLPVLAFTADQAFWWLREREEAEKAAAGKPSRKVKRPDPELVAAFRPSAKFMENPNGRPL